MIDAGAEYQNYAADITRTFPINGVFTEAQQQVYDLVLDAQLAVIAIIKPGVLWNKLQEMAVQVITKGLVELGLLKGNVATLIEDKRYQQFYMHNIGHFLGMDVHDVGSYKKSGKWRPLQEGMVLTVEPGIYISAGQKSVDKKWWNIGVRIEDDVLVTQNGSKVLSQKLPKTVAEIQQLMKGV